MSQGEAFTLASISYLAILIKSTFNFPFKKIVQELPTLPIFVTQGIPWHVNEALETNNEKPFSKKETKAETNLPNKV